MNKKGIILSVYIYMLLVFFLLTLGSLLVVLNNTRILSDKIKDSTADRSDNTKYGFSIELTGLKTVCQNFGVAYSEPGFRAVDVDGNEIGVTVNSDLDIWKSGTYNINYVARYNNKEKTVTRKVVVLNNDFKYTGSPQTFSVECDGVYQVELWGAEGMMAFATVTGKGAYTKGEVLLNKNTNLFVYVGGKGAYNGAIGSPASGGATDVRLITGNWDNYNGLLSRIMVSGGGGGAERAKGGDGGGLNGFQEFTLYGTSTRNGSGGSQTSGGARGDGTVDYTNGGAGSFGIGGHGGLSGDLSGGGGGGYYGGGGMSYAGSGGGGSSFISGYPGCDAVDIGGNHTGKPTHYSGIKFNNPVMLDGSKSMPTTTGATEVGHTGDGYARIMYLGTKEEVNNELYIMKKFIAIGNNNGIKLRIQKPDEAASVMVRKKTTPWVSTDTTATGTLVSNNITITNLDNVWYNDSTSTNGTLYYYKAFPFVNGVYKYLPYENETSAIGGGLYAEYLFESNLNDTSGNNYHSNGSAAITYQAGMFGSTAVFNGTSSFVASPVFLESGVYSVSVWSYLSSVSAGSAFIVSTAEGGGYTLYQDAGTSSYTFGVHFGGAYQYTGVATSLLNKWVNTSYVVDTVNRQIRIYFNAVLVKQYYYTGVYGASTLAGADRRTCIGCNPGASLSTAEYFNGRIDQVRFYNRELTASEILSLYNE